MRIFIHNVDTFLGRALFKELRRGDGGSHRIFGTVANDPDDAPLLKRFASRDDPKKAKKMAETIQSCRVVVIDLFNSSLEDLHFAISSLKVDPKASPPRPTGELEGDVTFILVSSVMVWAGTPAESEDGFLRDSDYLRRAPVAGSKYEQWREMENLVMSCFSWEGSTVKAFVVAGGVLYGEGEDTFSPLFKGAWRSVQEHAIIAPGTNRIPTVHVKDLARLVRHVGNNGDSIQPAETPYFIAVDQPPAPEGEKPLPSTQAEIIQGIVDEVSESYPVPTVPVPEGGPEAGEEGILEEMAVDLRLEPSGFMLAPEFAADSEPPGWWCRGGVVAEMRRIADEFCKERKLRAMRVLVAGPPGSGKSTLAKAISDHFKIPHLELNTAALEETASRLTSKVCRYRGYVLDAGCLGFAEVEKVFRYDFVKPAEEGEEPPAEPAEGEEAPPPQVERRLNEELCPEYVVVTQAPDAFCRARWQARGSPVAEFNMKMLEYSNANLSEQVDSLSDFFQSVAKISVLNLPVAGNDEEDLFESTRIYMESSGRPFNYLPTEEDVASGLLAAKADKVAADAQMAAAEAQQQAGSDVEQRGESRRHSERMRIIATHEEQRRQLAELPLREYLMRYMVPSLTEGLIEVCKVLPDNPVDYLATYLEEHAADVRIEN